MGAAHDAGTLTARAVKARLREREDPVRAAGEASFFKTGPGQYGEGDQFLGLSVPEQRRVAQQYRELPFVDLAALLQSPTHEDRFTALEILVMQYETGDAKTREGVFRFYLQHTDRINNWDLVDTSARYIVGEHLRDRSRARVYRLARSRSLWERRIAMVATHAWIATGDAGDAYAIAGLLLDDTHDLICEAAG